MTLNITLVTPDRIYQSSDFRLTLPGVGRLTYDSSKAVRLTGERFDGALTYTGIGEWRGRSTAQYVVDWLSDGGDTDLSGVTDQLVKHGNAWIAGIERATREKQWHTFVVVGFEDGLACVALVSNFETLADQRPSVQDRLFVSQTRSGKRVLAVVTGQRPAVDRTARQALERSRPREWCMTTTTSTAA